MESSLSRGRALAQTLGFTIIELVAAASVVLILAALIIPNYQNIINGAQQAVCASNMRSIRTGMDGYLQDHSLIWPQGPRPQDPGWADFWLQTLSPYGIKQRTWHCPTIKANLRGSEAPETLTLHYVPTMFDATKNIAYRWATQPWLIEAANAHGNGALICFPDGSVKPVNKVLAEQGLR
jgi:type II secretory pathway pseudopilin PulG